MHRTKDDPKDKWQRELALKKNLWPQTKAYKLYTHSNSVSIRRTTAACIPPNIAKLTTINTNQSVISTKTSQFETNTVYIQFSKQKSQNKFAEALILSHNAKDNAPKIMVRIKLVGPIPGCRFSSFIFSYNSLQQADNDSVKPISNPPNLPNNTTN